MKLKENYYVHYNGISKCEGHYKDIDKILRYIKENYSIIVNNIQNKNDDILRNHPNFGLINIDNFADIWYEAYDIMLKNGIPLAGVNLANFAIKNTKLENMYKKLT